MTKKTDYLIVGDNGNQAWAFACYGRKVEKALYQTKNRSGQDPLNFPIRLTNKLAHLNSIVQNEYPPTNQMIELQQELTMEIDKELGAFKEVKETLLPQFNKMMRELEVDAVILDESDE